MDVQLCCSYIGQRCLGLWCFATQMNATLTEGFCGLTIGHNSSTAPGCGFNNSVLISTSGDCRTYRWELTRWNASNVSPQWQSSFSCSQPLHLDGAPDSDSVSDTSKSENDSTLVARYYNTIWKTCRVPNPCKNNVKSSQSKKYGSLNSNQKRCTKLLLHLQFVTWLDKYEHF